MSFSFTLTDGRHRQTVIRALHLLGWCITEVRFVKTLLYSGETRNLDFILFQFKKRGVLSLAFELALNLVVFLTMTIGVVVFTI